MLWVVAQRTLWGGYGRILISGTAQRQSEGGPLLLHRAGPFLPPISFPWLLPDGYCFVVSGEFRWALEKSGFDGLRFRPAVKARIISLPWHGWDLAAEEPQQYPLNNEPEEYIWHKRHNPRVAAWMPDAWEFLPPVVPLRMEQLEDPRGGFLSKFRAFPEGKQYPSLFLSRHQLGNLVANDAGREWFENHAGGWVRFCEVSVDNAEPSAAADRGRN